MNITPGNPQDNIHSILRRPVSIKDVLKFIYFKLAPKGSKRYASSHIFIRKLFNARYHKWIKNCDRYSTEDLQNIIDQVQALPAKPLISVIMPVYNTDLDYLNQAIQSVRDQIYPYWEFCIADDASTKPGVRELLQKFSLEDNRINVQFRSTNGHISAASNTALAMASGEYVALLDHDDRLHPLALFYVVQEINAHPDCIVIYSDEDKLTPSGKRIDPYFKSDFDYDLFLSQNMVSHLGVYKRDALRKINGFREGLEGSQDYDLLLRILPSIELSQIRHIQKVLYHWRISEQSVADRIDIKPYALEAGRQALHDYLASREIAANINIFENFGYKIHYQLSEEPPKIEIVLQIHKPTDRLLATCQALIEDSNYDHSLLTMRLITNSGTFKLFEDRLQKIDQEVHFAFSENSDPDSSNLNHMIQSSTADYCGFIDETCIGYSPRWLAFLVSFATQPGVGCVSPKLVFRNGYIFSCGLVLGNENQAQYLFKGANAAHQNYYFGWSSLHKGYSSLPHQCTLFRRSDLVKLGGFNDNISDPSARHIELCLRMREAGLRNVVVPEAIVTVDQTKRVFGATSDTSIISNEDDRQYLLQRYQKWFDDDPAFNPNLCLRNGKPVVTTHPWSDH